MNSSLLSNRQPKSIEQSILDAKQKQISNEELLVRILTTDFYLLCDKKVLNTKEIMLPLCIKINGQNYVCVFTKENWAKQYFNQEAIMIKLQSKKTLKLIPNNYGLIINPNQDASVKFTDFGIQNIIKDFL